MATHVEVILELKACSMSIWSRKTGQRLSNSVSKVDLRNTTDGGE